MAKLKQAWGVIKQNPASLLGLALAYSVLEYEFLTKPLLPYLSSSSFLSFFMAEYLKLSIWFIFLLLFLTGFLPMVLIAIDGGTIKVASFKPFITANRIFNMLALIAVWSPVFIAGSILAIGGIIWSGFTIMAFFLISGDERTGTLNAISKSISITKGYRLKIMFYLLFYSIFSFLALFTPPYLAVVIDAFVVAFLYVTLALIYRECMNKNV